MGHSHYLRFLAVLLQQVQPQPEEEPLEQPTWEEQVEAFLNSRCSHSSVRKLQTMAVLSETRGWLEGQGIDIPLIPVAERIRGYNAVAWLAAKQGPRLQLKPAVERALLFSGHKIWQEKAYYLYQDFSDSEEADSEEDLDLTTNNKEVRWGFYPTPPSPTSGGPEFVPLLEGGEWDDLDLDLDQVD